MLDIVGYQPTKSYQKVICFTENSVLPFFRYYNILTTLMNTGLICFDLIVKVNTIFVRLAIFGMPKPKGE